MDETVKSIMEQLNNFRCNMSKYNKQKLLKEFKEIE